MYKLSVIKRERISSPLRVYVHAQERGRGEDARMTEIVSVMREMERQRGKEVEKGRMKEERKLG